ncbi:MAG TPA: hypothetical protein PKC21_06410 [Oligoflexia bacterium]|nr:hypothetical protein [Oligoflexia bacterium]HMR24967.1 hypothetical protein [Oligoflexia bacterium]
MNMNFRGVFFTLFALYITTISYAQNGVPRYFALSNCNIVEWPNILSERDETSFSLTVEIAKTSCCSSGYCLSVFANIPEEGTDIACELKNGDISQEFGTRIDDNTIKKINRNLDLKRRVPIVYADFVFDEYGKGVNLLLLNGEWIKARECEISKSDNFYIDINFTRPKP